MAKKVSNTTPLFGNKRSHSCKATRHAQKPNYVKVRTENGQTLIMTAREVRSAKKQQEAA